MHLNSLLSAVQILWTLTFAALLVLLVVLLGRDRARRFPWFTASIVLTALRLLASRMLFGRLANIPLSVIFITLANVALIVGLLVVVEVARRAFVGLSRRAWLAGTVVLLAVGGGVLAVWGSWPVWHNLNLHTLLGTLSLMQLTAQKGALFLCVVTIELGLLIVFVGDRFKAGWRSHPQRIVIGLSTAACAQLAVQGIWQLIALHAAPHSRAEFNHLMDLRDNLFNANGAVFVLVLVWWIICLWMDEPGSASSAAPETASATGTENA
jgi:hypothetical protein